MFGSLSPLSGVEPPGYAMDQLPPPASLAEHIRRYGRQSENIIDRRGQKPTAADTLRSLYIKARMGSEDQWGDIMRWLRGPQSVDWSTWGQLPQREP